MICDLFGVFLDARPRLRERTCFLPQVRKRPFFAQVRRKPVYGHRS